MSGALEEAEALLERLPDAVVRRRLGERLRQAVDALKTADRQVARITALLELSRIVDFGKTPDQREALQDMKDCAAAVGTSLENAEEAEGLRIAIFDYEDTLKKALGTLERLVRDRWRSFSSDRFQPLIGVGELLTSMNASKNLGSRLADCGRRGTAATNTGSVIELLPTVRALLADFDALQAERAAEIGDDEVGDFINALAERRATLAMVTPKVFEWLKVHDALQRLGINPR